MQVVDKPASLRQARALLASTALVLGFGLLAGQPAAVEAAYNGTCSTGSAVSSHAQESKDVTFDPYFITEVIGEARDEALLPCSGSGSFPTGADTPFVLPANLQWANSSSSNLIIQVGFARCTKTSCFVPNDGYEHPIWTPADNTGGVVALATWYHSGNALTRGSRYRFLAEPNGAGNWILCIQNYTAGESYVCSPAITNHWGSNGGNLAWWGAETNNTNSQMGVTATNIDVNISDMIYVYNSTAYRRDGFSSCEWVPASKPSYYECYVSTRYATNDTINPYTDNH